MLAVHQSCFPHYFHLYNQVPSPHILCICPSVAGVGDAHHVFSALFSELVQAGAHHAASSTHIPCMCSVAAAPHIADYRQQVLRVCIPSVPSLTYDQRLIFLEHAFFLCWQSHSGPHILCMHSPELSLIMRLVSKLPLRAYHPVCIISIRHDARIVSLCRGRHGLTASTCFCHFVDSF